MKFIITSIALFITFSTNAQFPAEIETSSLDGESGFKIYGRESARSFGNHVAGSGDFNGDGLADFVIAASRSNTGITADGAIYIIFGSDSDFNDSFELSDLDGNNGFKIFGSAEGDRLGIIGDPFADINSDGIDDLLLGAPGADISDGVPPGINTRSPGITYVIYGKELGFPPVFDLNTLDGINGFEIHGATLYEEAGYISSAGDINNDGYIDIFVGAPSADTNFSDDGTLNIIYGKEGSFESPFLLSNINGTNGFKIHGGEHNSSLGTRASKINDFNSDGIDDFAIADSRTDLVYVIFGNELGFASTFDLSTLNGENGFMIRGENTLERFRTNINSAGDLNNDGILDIIIADSLSFANGERSGAIYVLFGSKTTFPPLFQISDIDGENGFKVYGLQEWARLGRGRGAGDINDDGISDIVIGGREGIINNGVAYVIYGKDSTNFPSPFDLTTLDGTNGFEIKAESLRDNLGSSLQIIDDINGDGNSDILLGANGVGLGGGGAYVVFGKGAQIRFELTANVGDDNVASSGDAFTYNLTFSNTGNLARNYDIDDIQINLPEFTNHLGNDDFICVETNSQKTCSNTAAFTVIPESSDVTLTLSVQIDENIPTNIHSLFNSVIIANVCPNDNNDCDETVVLVSRPQAIPVQSLNMINALILTFALFFVYLNYIRLTKTV